MVLIISYLIGSSVDTFESDDYTSTYTKTSFYLQISLSTENIPAAEEVTLTPRVFVDDVRPPWLDEVYYSDVTVDPMEDDVFDMKITPPEEDDYFSRRYPVEYDHRGRNPVREDMVSRRKHFRVNQRERQRPVGGRIINNRRRPLGGGESPDRRPIPPHEDYRGGVIGEGGWVDNRDVEEEDYRFGEWISRPGDVERGRGREREREWEDARQRDSVEKVEKLIVTTRLVCI